MGLQHIEQTILNDNYNQAIGATWGHLAPEENKQYRGEIIFAHNCYGDTFAIDWKFEDLNSSPWFYDCLQEFMYQCDTEGGKVYRFTGTFCNYKFKGELEKLKWK